jgi:molybdopterin/thiamine biosynthesis adenylyltransferase
LIGGLGGLVAYELAAAGVGRLILAHGGDLKPSDLNRQLLMKSEALGSSRINCAVERLKELNPRLEITPIPENVTESNVSELVAGADVVVDCAPLFEERYLMNREAFRQDKPLVECSMFEMEAHITSFKPGSTGCLQCLYPEKPDYWQRRFPVFGAVSGMVGCLGAMEAIMPETALKHKETPLPIIGVFRVKTLQTSCGSRFKTGDVCLHLEHGTFDQRFILPKCFAVHQIPLFKQRSTIHHYIRPGNKLRHI